LDKRRSDNKREAPESGTLPVDDLRRRINRYKGTTSQPPPWKQGKSTTIRIYDIAKLASVSFQNLGNFMHGRRNIGVKVNRRLTRALLLVESGRVQKLQYGVYEIHDKPVTAPVKTLKVAIVGGEVKVAAGDKDPEVRTMPNFNEVFGRK